MRYAMIMAGGAGTRLWPMSRKQQPKQLLKFIKSDDGRSISLLELAAQRVEGLIDPSRSFICTSESYRDVIRRDVPQFAGKDGDSRIMGEPMGRDTVNAVGFAAAVFQKLDKDASFAVLTADHVIEPRDAFRSRMEVGFKLVEEDPRRLVTFSITPTYPATGFGYVERGTPIRDVPDAMVGGKPIAFHVERFVEKPDLPRAQAYVQSGQFGWNSGMFVWKARTFLDALKQFKPENHEGVTKIAEAWGTKHQRETIEKIYPTLPKISVDYAVMEPASKERNGKLAVCTVQMDVKWLDVGSWPSFGETLSPDPMGNRVSGPAQPLIVKGKNNLVVSSAGDHTIALLGCDDLIVVRTSEATLIMPRARAEELKDLHALVDERLK